ncbi:MAG: NosD domain-containing protein [Candidatus Kariarchaeaceae archaeon]|jgi:parallel beta-helix repeat protein
MQKLRLCVLVLLLLPITGINAAYPAQTSVESPDQISLSSFPEFNFPEFNIPDFTTSSFDTEFSLGDYRFSTLGYQNILNSRSIELLQLESPTPTVLLSGLEYPRGLWVKDDVVFFTETGGPSAGHSLSKYDVGTQQGTLLKDGVTASYAVVVASDDTIYLSAPVQTIPGEEGVFTKFDQNTGIETTLFNINVAATDMHIDSNDDIYLLGSSDSPSAQSIYYLPSYDYTDYNIMQTGLGRTWGIGKVNDTIIYSDVQFNPTTQSIKWFSGINGQIWVLDERHAISLSSSDDYLYYADYFAGTVGRYNYDGLTDEVLLTNLNGPTHVHFDAATGNLYYMEAGTSDTGFTDGTLNVLPVEVEIPVQSIAYIYGDSTAALSYEVLLEEEGFIVDLFALRGLDVSALASYDLIVIGLGTGSGGSWGGLGLADAIAALNLPIIGLGEGGYAYFGQLDLEIGYPHGAHGFDTSIDIKLPEHQIFNAPFAIPSGTVQLYDVDSGDAVIYAPGTNPEANVDFLASITGSEVYYPLAAEDDHFFLWGFDASASYMTLDAKNLFKNVAHYFLGTPIETGVEAPVVIQSNADFAQYASSGDGTADNPWIIEGLDLAHATEDLLTISGTTDYFILRDSNFDGLYGSSTGIVLVNVVNGVISGNSIHSANTGVAIMYSTGITVSGNTIYDNAANGIFLVDSDNNLLENNILYGNGYGGAGDAIDDSTIGLDSIMLDAILGSGIFLDPSSGNTVSGNQIYDNYGVGVLLESSDNTDISDNTIARNDGSGIFFIDSNENSITGNTISQNGGTASLTQSLSTIGLDGIMLNAILGSGIFLDPSSDNEISGNTVTDNGGIGILLEQSDNTIISGNEVSGNDGSGVFLLDSSENTIYANTVSGNGGTESSVTTNLGLDGIALNAILGSGIFLDPSSDNVISDNTVTDNGGIGILLEQSEGTSISGNTVSGNDASGVFLLNSNYNSITGNAISANGGASNGGEGLGLDSITLNAILGSGIFLDPSFNNTISGNSVTDNAGIGIMLEESDYTYISDNTVSGNDGSGVFLVDSDDNTITNNDVTQNGVNEVIVDDSTIGLDSITLNAILGSGIFLDPSSGNTISDNNVEDNAGIGILLQESDNTDISGNSVSGNDGSGVFLLDSNDNSINANYIGGNGGTASTLDTGVGLDEITLNAILGSGIFLDPSSGNTISNNNVTSNAGIGILLEQSDNTEISNNAVNGNEGSGVFLINSDENSITDNYVTENGAGAPVIGDFGLGLNSIMLHAILGSGIFLDPSSNNVISGNTVSDNAANGISLEYSDNTLISGNEVSGNDGSGVFLLDSDNNTIDSNDIGENGGYAEALSSSSLGLNSIMLNAILGSGIFLDPSHHNKITGNTIFGNTGDGILIDSSNFTYISHNTIANHSFYGLNIFGGSSFTDILSNDFFANNEEGTSQANDEGTDNEFDYNFFDDHDNTDNNGDGIADDPYYIDGGNTDETPTSEPSAEITTLEVELDISPHKLNLKSNGKWVEAKIKTPGFAIININETSIMLNGTVQAQRIKSVRTNSFKAKFLRSEVIQLIKDAGLEDARHVTLTVTGLLNDDFVAFEGHDSIKIENKSGRTTWKNWWWLFLGNCMLLIKHGKVSKILWLFGKFARNR